MPETYAKLGQAGIIKSQHSNSKLNNYPIAVLLINQTLDIFGVRIKNRIKNPQTAIDYEMFELFVQ
jgi:hypothetical protein